MNLTDREAIERALTRLGELLEGREEHYSIVVIGGAALNLLNIVNRATVDVDILAFADPSLHTGLPVLVEPPHPLPPSLTRAIEQIGGDLKLGPKWLNTGPALQWRQGLPPGLGDRVEWRQFGALRVGLASRYDLIFFKLYAAADSPGPSHRHFRDLMALRPTDAELEDAKRWVREQDASVAFHDVLEKVVAYARTVRKTAP